MDWRDLERLPAAAPESWQAKLASGRVLRDKSAVDAAVGRWNPLDPLLISPPGSARFLPVLFVDEYREQARRRALRNHARGVTVMALVGCLLAIGGYLGGRPNALRAALMAAALSLFAAIDYQVVVKRLDALTERTLLALWVVDRGRRYAMGWALVMAAAGIAQLWGEASVGGHEALLLKIGVVYEYVGQGEVWRLATGPFLHAGFAHWLTNLAMLVFVGAVAGALLGPASAWLFLSGSSLGASASVFSAAYSHTDAYVGVSAGVFAMLGWCAGAAWRRPERFPSAFALTALAFALLNLAIAWLANPHASNVGHLSGLAFGFLWGAVLPAPRACVPRRG